jgi:hypothetical protein
MTEERVTPLDLPVRTIVKLMKGLGKGAAEALPGPRSFGNASA